MCWVDDEDNHAMLIAAFVGWDWNACRTADMQLSASPLQLLLLEVSDAGRRGDDSTAALRPSSGCGGESACTSKAAQFAAGPSIGPGRPYGSEAGSSRS